MARKTDKVTVTCYNQVETGTRKELMAKYREGMICCDGSERDRYTSIYCGLNEGYDIVDDDWNWSYSNT